MTRSSCTRRIGTTQRIIESLDVRRSANNEGSAGVNDGIDIAQNCLSVTHDATHLDLPVTLTK